MQSNARRSTVSACKNSGYTCTSDLINQNMTSFGQLASYHCWYMAQLFKGRNGVYSGEISCGTVCKYQTVYVSIFMFYFYYFFLFNSYTVSVKLMKLVIQKVRNSRSNYGNMLGIKFPFRISIS